MAEEKVDPSISSQADWQVVMPQHLPGAEQASEWAMTSYEMPPENVAFIQSLLAAEVDPSVIPIRRLPTR